MKNEYIDGGYTTEDAIGRAIDYCIENDILADILIKCKSEVTDMLLTEFDEKLYKKTIYREGYEDGVSEGFERGISEGFERGHKSGISEGFERGINEASEQAIKNSIAMLKSMNLPDEEIAGLIVENYAVSKEDIIKELNNK